MASPHSFDSAYRQIKQGQLAPAYYLTGDEDVLKDELISWIMERTVDVASRDFNVDVRSATDLDGEAFHALVETPPMLAERRVVVVRGVEQWRKNARVWQIVERYLANPSPTTVLVLTHAGGEKVHRVLASLATHVDVAPLSADRVRRWVVARAKALGLALDDETVAYLVDAVGTNLQDLSTELGKLYAAYDGGEALTASAVAALVGVRQGETPRDWVTAVLARDIPRAVAMLEGVLSASGVTAVRLLATLGTQLVGVRLTAELARARGAGSLERQVFDAIRRARPAGLGDWKSEARAWARAVTRWPIPELDRALRAAYEADKALKSTTVSDDMGVLSTLLVQHVATRAAA